MRFQDKVVVVTGASAGVGAACARQFSAQGAKLVLAARGQADLDALAAELGGPERALAVPTDVSDPVACERLISAAVDAFGGIDVLVNNAGFNARGGVAECRAEDLARIVDVNLRAPIVLTALAMPWLEKRDGAVVNVASLAGRIPLPHEATYSATKFGLRAFTLALHEEVRDGGMRASVVSPGPIETGFIMNEIETVPDLVFSQPMSSADDIARAILQCAHDGRPERAIPAASGKLTTLGYLLPGLMRPLRPLFQRKGAKAKAAFIARQQNAG